MQNLSTLRIVLLGVLPILVFALAVLLFWNESPTPPPFPTSPRSVTDEAEPSEPSVSLSAVLGALQAADAEVSVRDDAIGAGGLVQEPEPDDSEVVAAAVDPDGVSDTGVASDDVDSDTDVESNDGDSIADEVDTTTPSDDGLAAAEVGPACGNVTCNLGWECCNASCGVCVQPGEKCSQRPCGEPLVPASVTCGPVTCDVGEICCDAACGRCIRPGETCVPRACLSPVTIPHSESCGMITCNVDTVCCNPSCGICKPYGEPCSQERCE